MLEALTLEEEVAAVINTAYNKTLAVGRSARTSLKRAVMQEVNHKNIT